ncbi:hypothetical protein CSA_021701, partial [Cucumis sativus]
KQKIFKNGFNTKSDFPCFLPLHRCSFRLLLLLTIRSEVISVGTYRQLPPSSPNGL